MLRTFGLFIAICLIFGGGAKAQDVATLVVTSNENESTLDVSTEEPVVTQGVVQLSTESVGSGILFDLRQEAAIAVSSEAAPVASDLILISPSGTIMAIVRNAAPGSQNPIIFSGQTAAVLQLSAGSAAASGFHPGGSISSDILGKQASEVE